MKVLVLGAGKMIEAILTGLKGQEDLSDWTIYSPSGISADVLAQKVGAKSLSNLDLISAPDWILVGCKPQQLKDLKITLNGRFKSSIYVSLLAAILEKDQKEILGVEKLVRVMPNLPVRFKKGVSLISSSSAYDEMRIFHHLFSKLGMAISLNEHELEELTLLTGSGPALFYEFTHMLSASFESLNANQRENLARQILAGAAHSASLGTESLTEMTNAVTSKGGVTIAVLEKWHDLNLSTYIQEGIRAGKNRAKELRELFGLRS